MFVQTSSVGGVKQYDGMDFNILSQYIKMLQTEYNMSANWIALIFAVALITKS